MLGFVQPMNNLIKICECSKSMQIVVVHSTRWPTIRHDIYVSDSEDTSWSGSNVRVKE